MNTPNTPTPRIYKDVAGDVVSLHWLVEHEPDWAVNQILHRDKIEHELAEMTNIAHKCRARENELLEELAAAKAEVERATAHIAEGWTVKESDYNALLEQSRELRSDLEAAKRWIDATVENCSVFSEPPKFKSP